MPGQIRMIEHAARAIRYQIANPHMGFGMRCLSDEVQRVRELVVTGLTLICHDDPRFHDPSPAAIAATMSMMTPSTMTSMTCRACAFI
jgi:hypothetical protein